jgi:hypothetical protein
MSRVKEPGRPASEAAQPLARYTGVPCRDYYHLWFALATRAWRSAVLVPAGRRETAAAAEAASALAAAGRLLHELPVTLFIMSSAEEYATAVEFVNVAASREEAARQGTAAAPDLASAVHLVASAATTPRTSPPPSGKVIVAIQPVIEEPLGLAVTQAADVVVLCAERGVTRMKSVRRTIELIGRGRIAGCLLGSPR